MISMVEKICRLKLNECEKVLCYMKKILEEHRQEFFAMPEILDFEREWMEKYVG